MAQTRFMYATIAKIERLVVIANAKHIRMRRHLMRSVVLNVLNNA